MYVNCNWKNFLKRKLGNSEVEKFPLISLVMKYAYYICLICTHSLIVMKNNNKSNTHAKGI